MNMLAKHCMCNYLYQIACSLRNRLLSSYQWNAWKFLLIRATYQRLAVNMNKKTRIFESERHGVTRRKEERKKEGEPKSIDPKLSYTLSTERLSKHVWTCFPKFSTQLLMGNVSSKLKWSVKRRDSTVCISTVFQRHRMKKSEKGQYQYTVSWNFLNRYNRE